MAIFKFWPKGGVTVPLPVIELVRVAGNTKLAPVVSSDLVVIHHPGPFVNI